MAYPEWIDAHQFLAYPVSERDAAGAIVRERWLICIEAGCLSPSQDRDAVVIFGDVDESESTSDEWTWHERPVDPWVAGRTIADVLRLDDGRISIVSDWDAHTLQPDHKVWLVVNSAISRGGVIRWGYPRGDKRDPAEKPVEQYAALKDA